MTQQSQDNAQWIRTAVEKFQAPLLVYAARLLNDQELARDAVQETFLRLCDQDPAKVRDYLAPWLFTVCRNLSLNMRRKDARMTGLSDARANLQPSRRPDPAAQAQNHDEQSQAQHYLQGLPENQQEVIRLKFQNGLTYRQIAKVTGLPVSTVGYLIHTGLATIRKQMTSPNVEPGGD